MTTPSAPGAGEAQVVVNLVKDVAVRAFHTFWQAAAGSLAVSFSASGLDVHQIASVAGAEKVGLGFAASAVAAGLSALKTLVLSYQSGKKALS